MHRVNIDSIKGLVEVLGAHLGGAPKAVGSEDGHWLGVKIPCLYYIEAGHPVAEGIVTQKRTYVVLQEDALLALGKVRPEIANRWRECGYPHHDGANFYFDLVTVCPGQVFLTKGEFSGLLRSLTQQPQ